LGNRALKPEIDHVLPYVREESLRRSRLAGSVATGLFCWLASEQAAITIVRLLCRRRAVRQTAAVRKATAT